MNRLSRGLPLAACALPLLLAACGTLLPPAEPMLAEPPPWVPARDASEPGDDSPRYPQN